MTETSPTRQAAAPPAGADLVVRDTLDDAAAAMVRALVVRAERVDGTAALNENALLHLRANDGCVRHVLAYDADASLLAYAHLDLSEARARVTAECVVDPRRRREGLGSAVVARALREVDGAPVLLWSHGDHPGAARMAERLGFGRVRDLWQLRRPLNAAPGADVPELPAVGVPDGITVRTYRPGHDERAFLGLNARAFADHPEQGSMDAGDLAQRTGSDWFDPVGFFLAERDGRLVGFHWTKVHAGEGGEPAVGEVYVVGVDPDEQGSGLGRALTAAGLRYLADRGLREVLLYVEADNAPAKRVYERLGFRHVATDTQYRHPGLART